jgi:hypothetical protein
MSGILGGLACRAPDRFGGLRRLLERNETQGERPAGFAPNPDGPIDKPADSGVLELREQADRGVRSGGRALAAIRNLVLHLIRSRGMA